MQDIQNNGGLQSIIIDFSNFENKSEVEKREIIIVNIKFIRDLLIQKKKEKDDEIMNRVQFIKFLDSLPQNPKIKELANKETDLIYFLKEYMLLLESTVLVINHLENIISSSEKEDKLRSDIDMLIDMLKKENVLR